MSELTLGTRSSFTHLPFSTGPGSGVIAIERNALAIVRVVVSKGRVATLAQRVLERFGIELPRGPQRAEAGGIAFVGLSSDTWLVTADRHPGETCTLLYDSVGEIASISDQSSAYAVLRLTGPNVRDTLAKIIPIDLHDLQFRRADAASTAASHIAIILWRLEEAPDSHPVFEMAVPRSFAASFWQALTEGAAEYGFVVKPCSPGAAPADRWSDCHPRWRDTP